VVELLVDPAPLRLVTERVSQVLRPGSRLGVAGGSVLGALGALRSALPPQLFASLSLAWVDERCVPFSAPDSNRGSAYRAGHLTQSQPPARELVLFEDGETPEQACHRVALTLKRDFADALDVLLLGMGEDGHIASLFPGQFEPLDEAPVRAIKNSPKPPPCRITLTLALLATARQVFILAAGEGKRAAVARLTSGDRTLPAAHLPNLVLVTDQG